MSTSAILSVTGSAPNYDFASASATTSQQTVFNNVLARFKQAISVGDISTTKTLLNTINVLSPPSAASASSLGIFLTSVNAALANNSVSQAQSALATYQSAAPTTTSTPASSATTASDTASLVAANLIQSQLHQQLVSQLLAQANSIIANAGSVNSSNSSNSNNSINSLVGILQTAYGTSPASSSSASSSDSSNNSSNPYDALLASIQASLAAGHGTLTPALAYLQANGNFVNTSA